MIHESAKNQSRVRINTHQSKVGIVYRAFLLYVSLQFSPISDLIHSSKVRIVLSNIWVIRKLANQSRVRIITHSSKISKIRFVSSSILVICKPVRGQNENTPSKDRIVY